MMLDELVLLAFQSLIRALGIFSFKLEALNKLVSKFVAVIFAK